MIRVDIKFFIARPFLSICDEYIEKIRDMWESKWLTNMGKSVELQ